MRKLKPKVNIERHTLDITELETRIRELENLKKGYQDELGWINELLERAEARVKELEKDNNDLIEVNHSVSVCRNHTSEITNFDGCLVCRIEELEGAIEKHRDGTRKYEYVSGLDEELYSRLSKPSTDIDR